MQIVHRISRALLAVSCTLALGVAAAPAHAVGPEVEFTNPSANNATISGFSFGSVAVGTTIEAVFGVKNVTPNALTGIEIRRVLGQQGDGLVFTQLPQACNPTNFSLAASGSPGDSCSFKVALTVTASGSVMRYADIKFITGNVLNTLQVSAQGTSGGGGMSGSDISTITLDSDGTTVRWSTASTRALVFCAYQQSFAACNPPAGMLYYYSLTAQMTSLTVVEGLAVKRWVNNGEVPDTLPAGNYTLYVYNSPVSSSNGLDVTAGAGGQLPSPVAVFPAISASEAPALTAAVVDTTVKCSAPSFDVEPTSIEISLAIDGAELKRETLTKKPFELSSLVPATSSGKTLMCTVTARNDKGSTTISADAVISAKSAINPSTPVKPATPGTQATCSGTRVIGFGNAATSMSASGSAAASVFAAAACKYTVTGYSQPSSSRASALAAARANAVAAAIKAANPNAVVTVVNGGKTKNASCAKVSNRCVVVSRG